MAILAVRLGDIRGRDDAPGCGADAARKRTKQEMIPKAASRTKIRGDNSHGFLAHKEDGGVQRFEILIFSLLSIPCFQVASLSLTS